MHIIIISIVHWMLNGAYWAIISVNKRLKKLSVKNNCHFVSLYIIASVRHLLSKFAKNCVLVMKVVIHDWFADEVSDFVELVSLYLGESDLAAVETRHLLEALNGYSSLLFESEFAIDLSSLLALCGDVWRHLEKTPDLPQYLVSS